MASLIKTVKKDGSGDYTDLASGVNDILASGLAATGVYTQFELLVDSGYYVGSFTADVPYSGVLSIIGNSGTWFEPTGTCFISGTYDQSISDNNFYLKNIRIVGSGTSNTLFSIAADTKCEFNNTKFLDILNGIYCSGQLVITDSSALGTGSGYFAVCPTGTISVSNSDMIYFGVCLSGIVTINNYSRLLDNGIGIYSNRYASVQHALFSGASGIVMTSGELQLLYATMDTTSECLTLNDVSLLNIEKSILVADTSYTIVGANVSGIVSTSCLYSGSWDPVLTNISGINNINSDPLFNNTIIQDYRLVLKDTIGSPCIEVFDNLALGSGVELITDQGQLVFNNKQGMVSSQNFRDVVYKQGNTLLFSDYLKEPLFAELMDQYSITGYNLFSRITFTASDVSVTPAIEADGVALHPYDWDFKSFNTPEITDENEYVIPRAVMNVSTAISEYVGNYFSNIVFGSINKSMITAYLNKDLRGISYDFDLSNRGVPIVWALEGTNQILSKINPGTGEVFDAYPLLITSRSDKLIYPSGLIPAGVFKDKYKYLLESNPQIEFLSAASDGGFKWIATSLDPKKDARGILAYKGNLFITLSNYVANITDRSVTPTGEALGTILLYNNNHIFEHYIANYTMEYEPTQLPLASDNTHPTDITIYEDGIIYIADYLNNSGLYQYKLAYDYAMIQSSYDRDSLVLLREAYENVEI